MENKLNESEDNKEEGEKGGKKEEVGDKRSPILGRQKKRFAKDDNKNNNNKIGLDCSSELTGCQLRLPDICF